MEFSFKQKKSLKLSLKQKIGEYCKNQTTNRYTTSNVWDDW